MSRLRRGSFRLAVAGLVTVLLHAPGIAHAGYSPGRGLSILGDRLTIGGYLSVEAAFLDQEPDRFAVEDLSAIVTFRLTDHWLLFTEAEVEDPVHVDAGGVGSGGNVFSLERLYAQWEGSAGLRVRFGKMLTPFGIWNLIHAEPLVWTSSRPIATEAFFDTGLTGIEATATTTLATTELSLTAFGQITDHLDDPNDVQESRRAIGGRFAAGFPGGPDIGASVVRFRDHNDGRNETAFGADLLWALPRAEVSAELAANAPDSGSATWGGYLQGVLHAGHDLHPFVRVEYADLGSFDRVPVVFGVAWKPGSTMVLKVEGILGGDDTSLGGDGVLTSFSVLF